MRASRRQRRVSCPSEPAPPSVEERLRASEARLREAQRLARLGSWELDLVSGRLEWSEVIYEIFEIDPARFGASYEAFLAAVHPEDRARVDRAYRDSVVNREPYELVHRLLMADGRVKWVHERGRTDYSPSGVPLRSVGTVQDITERHNLEQARVRAEEEARRRVERSEQRLAEAHRLAALGAWELDLTTGEVWWSEQQYALNGIEPGEPIRQERFLELIHPDDRARFDEGFDVALRTGGWSGEYRIVRPDGAVRLMYGIASTTVNEAGVPIRMAGTNQDITERRRVEERIAASLREKETLLREVHHRVKNNLQVVASLLHFQAKKTTDPDQALAFHELRRRMMAMTLVHERLYRSPDVARVAFADYARALVREIERSFEPKQGVSVRVQIDGLFLPMETALPCGMIVSELVTNALKYAFPGHRGGTVTLSVEVLGDRARLLVEDDGVGFPEGFRPEQSWTFGWELVRTLALQVDGEVRAWNDGGVHAEVSFPLPDAAQGAGS